MVWPPYSTDLNFNVRLRGILKQAIYKDGKKLRVKRRLVESDLDIYKHISLFWNYKNTESINKRIACEIQKNGSYVFLYYLLTTVKHGSRSVMVWAAISWNSFGPVVALHSRINSKDYLNNLGDHIHPMVQALFPGGDDNSPMHTAHGLRIGKKNMKVI